MNLGEEVILTLLWQSGASESVTVCFVISLSICYWLLKCRVLRVVCVCVCVWERERERERERQGHITVESAILIAACVQIHTSFITVSVTRRCSPLGFELVMGRSWTIRSFLNRSLMWLGKNESSRGVIRSVAHAQHPIGSALNKFTCFESSGYWVFESLVHHVTAP